MNHFTDWFTNIESALENDKTAYLALKVLFFVLNCNVLYFDLFPVINADDPIVLPAFMMAILASIFITSCIWGSLLLAEAVWQLRVRVIKNIHSQNGWVLIDSLTAVLFVSVAFVALMLAYTMATRDTTESTNRIQATYLAQQALEMLKMQDNTTTFTPPVASSVTVGNIAYNVTVNTLPVPTIANTAGLSAKLFPVQATVTWTDSTGGPASKTVSIAGYYYVQ